MTIYLPYDNGMEELSARQRRNAVADPYGLWPNDTVPYEISSNFSGEGEKELAFI